MLGVLRESHKVRVQFRKTGGYLGLISMLLGLEGAFSKMDGARGKRFFFAFEPLRFSFLYVVQGFPFDCHPS